MSTRSATPVVLLVAIEALYSCHSGVFWKSCIAVLCSEYAEDVVSTKGMFCEIFLCPGYGVGGLVTSGITSLGRPGKGLLLLNLCLSSFLGACRIEYSVPSCVAVLPLSLFLLAFERGRNIVRLYFVGSLHLEKWRVEAFSLMLRSRA